MRHTLTLDYCVDVAAGPGWLHDVQGSAEVVADDTEAGFEVVAVSLHCIPPGRLRFEEIEIGRYRCDYTSKVDAATPFAEALTRAIADALLKDEAFSQQVDDALSEASGAHHYTAAEARSDERRERAA